MPEGLPESTESTAEAPPGGRGDGAPSAREARSTEDPSSAGGLAEATDEGHGFIVFVVTFLLGLWAARHFGMPLSQMLLEFALPVFLVTHFTLQGLRWLREADRKEFGARTFRSLVGKFSGSFYGAVCFLTYLRLEVLDLRDLWQGAPDAWAFLSSLSFERVFYFGLDSVANGFKAALWPVQWSREFGAETWLLIFYCWLIYRAVLYLLKPWLPAPDSGGQLLVSLGSTTQYMDSVAAELSEMNRNVSELERELTGRKV